jgi:hypothetical protein
MASALLRSGARRPEKRVTQRSKLPPKEMHRTALAKEKRAELVKNTIGREQNTPEPVGKFGVVESVHEVLGEWDRIGDLVRDAPDLGVNAERLQCVH